MTRRRNAATCTLTGRDIATPPKTKTRNKMVSIEGYLTAKCTSAWIVTNLLELGVLFVPCNREEIHEPAAFVHTLGLDGVEFRTAVAQFNNKYTIAHQNNGNKPQAMIIVSVQLHTTPSESGAHSRL